MKKNMEEKIYTDAPPEIEKEMSEGRILNISLDDLVKQSKKERVPVILNREQVAQ